MSDDLNLGGLPPLPSIGASGSMNTQSSASSGAAPAPDSGPSLASKIASSVLFGGIPIQRIVVILIGLLLIAAGIFAFRPVRETVVTTAKTGAKAAAAL